MSASPALDTSPMCAVHVGVPSAGTCSRCGRFGCGTCLNDKGICPECVSRAATSVEPLEGRATLASMGLLAMAGIHAIMALLGGAQLATGQVGEESPLAIVSALVGLLYLVAFITTVVLFCMWFHRAAAHALARGAGLEVTTPGQAVGSWFIPFLNLVRPFRLARAMLGNAGIDQSSVNSWQGFWISGNIIANASARANGTGSIALGLVSDLLLVGAALTAAGIVRRLKWSA